jgi:hypothetical protein
MALPPKGDPQRPLHLAVRSTRVLGILFIALGACGMLPMFYLGLARGRTPGGGMPMGAMAMLGISTILFYFGPGAAYLVCSIFIARRRTWAVITAMVLAAIQLLFITFGLVALLVMFLSAGARSLGILIALAIAVLLILALAQLEYHLSKCFEAIRRAPIDVQRGFEPLPAVPVVPIVDAPGESDGHSLPR